MDPLLFNVILKLRNLNKSQIAKMAGVSRQAVSLWTKKSQIEMRTQNLKKLADSLGVKVDDLIRPLPILHEKSSRELYQASLLWDHLYLSLEDFFVALVKGENKALARLVQVYGIFESANICGVIIWKKFNAYKAHLHPVRRTQLERIWNLHEHPELIWP